MAASSALRSAALGGVRSYSVRAVACADLFMVPRVSEFGCRSVVVPLVVPLEERRHVFLDRFGRIGGCVTPNDFTAFVDQEFREVPFHCLGSQKALRFVLQVFEDSLRKMVEEVVDNAFKFSLPGKSIQLTGQLVDDNYEIIIADNGRGLTYEQIQQIGPFMQFERRFYEQQGGGFGLMIARRSAELFGGDLRIASVPHERTTVTIRLPIVPMAEMA